jgi:hypothetical protein
LATVTHTDPNPMASQSASPPIGIFLMIGSFAASSFMNSAVALAWDSLAVWAKAVLAIALLAGVLCDETVAPVTISATAVPNSNLVEIRMLTHTSASRSRASIRSSNVLGLLRRKQAYAFKLNRHPEARKRARAPGSHSSLFSA